MNDFIPQWLAVSGLTKSWCHQNWCPGVSAVGDDEFEASGR